MMMMTMIMMIQQITCFHTLDIDPACVVEIFFVHQGWHYVICWSFLSPSAKNLLVVQFWSFIIHGYWFRWRLDRHRCYRLSAIG
jgi:hypothetical protein